MSGAVVDLRSDTVTRPTPEMRRAMADAEVGDDAYGEDPTVNALEDVFAERVGKAAAVFVPSGTMGNQLAVRVLARPGTLVICGARAHLAVHEGGAGSYNSGVQLCPLADRGGRLEPAAVRWVVDAAAHHQPDPGLLWLEDTYMHAAGAVLRPDELAPLVAAGAGIPVHLDGARLWNAEVATGLAAASFAAQATTVMCCLSKGLCAPVGSLLAGPADVIAQARVERARLGGAMRQAGVLAAAGLVALSTMVERLAEDHVRARLLVDAVADRWPDQAGEMDRVETNIVTFSRPDAEAVVAHLEAEGVLAGTIAPGVVRLVTHHDVGDDGLDRARKAIAAYPAR